MSDRSVILWPAGRHSGAKYSQVQVTMGAVPDASTCAAEPTSLRAARVLLPQSNAFPGLTSPSTYFTLWILATAVSRSATIATISESENEWPDRRASRIEPSG